MADQKVPPKDILIAFKRLKSLGENKICFDCNASNPTWASITYGVFLCIDCSAVHRHLGVHLTFIRSTQLDTNWTWLQLRHMQLGGNGKANAFFRQHNLNTKDAAVKYNSRIAAMYRDKLDSQCRKHINENGVSSIHIDTHHSNTVTTPEQKDVDFFQNIEQYTTNTDSPNTIKKNTSQDHHAHKDVDVGHLSSSPPKKDVRIPTIGARKPAAKKGLGAKKKGGLGATKTKTNFDAIEHETKELEKHREKMSEAFEPMKSSGGDSTPEDTPAPLATSLVYKTTAIKREEDKLRQSDPKKAEQMQRLGMGFGGRSGMSHSVSDSIKTVDQVKPSKSNDSSFFSQSSKSDFFDSYEIGGSSAMNSYKDDITEQPPSYESRHSNNGMPSWGSSNGSSYKSEREDSYSSRSRGSRQNSTQDSSPNEELRTKYANAKGISSDQIFGNAQEDATRGRLNEYSNSNSIGSADLFGEKSKQASSVDMHNIKESVQNVTGKLSNMASGVIGSLQSRYSGNN